MTKSLPTRLKEFCEFEKDRSHNEFEKIAGLRPFDGEPEVLYHREQYGFINGQRLENARLKPVLDALVECVISLRMYSNDNMRIGSTVTPYWADESLAKLERLLNEMEKK